MKSLYIILGMTLCTHSFAIERYMVDGGTMAAPPQKKIQTDDLPQIKAVADINNSYINMAAIPPRASSNNDNLINDDTKILLGKSLLAGGKEVEKQINEFVPPKKTTHMNLTNMSKGVGIATSTYELVESTDDCFASTDKTTSTQGCAKMFYDGYQVIKNGVDAAAEYKDAFKQASKYKIFSNNVIVNTIDVANSLVQGGIASYDPIVNQDYPGAFKQFIQQGKPFETGLSAAGGAIVLGSLPSLPVVVVGLTAATVGQLTGQVVDVSTEWAISAYETAQLQDELIKDKEASLRRKMVKQAAFEMKSIELQREQDKMRSEAQKQHDDMIFMQQVVMPAITSPAGGTAVTAPAGDWETSKGRNQGGTEWTCHGKPYWCVE